MALQHLRSSTADKRPTPAAMSDGQLAMNTNLVSPGLFFKDSNGDSVKIGPVHVGTTAPNVTPGAGGQAGNSKGEAWLDTTAANPILKVWNGSAFVAVQPVGTGTVVSTTDTGTVTSTMILDGTIVNADVNVSAAIDGTKISPDFGSQTITTTGIISPALGTAAAPSIAFTGDLDTGIYSPGADQVAVATNGAGRLFVDASGNAGFSTPSPATRVEISRIGEAWTGAAPLSGSALFIHNGNNNSATATHVQISAGNASTSVINFGDEDEASRGRVTYDHSSDALFFNTAGGERLRITSAGLVGIGTSAPATTLDVNGDVTITDKIIHGGDTNTAIRFPTTDTFTIETAGNERMRIDSSGRILLTGTTESTPGNGNTETGITFNSDAIYASKNEFSISVNRNNDGRVIRISRSGTQVGTITVTASATAYNTSSDYRLKENVVDLDGAIARLKRLPVHRFNFIAEPDTVVDGFIAHEAAEVVPECVTGTKDEVDEDGNPQYQGIDQSKMVPLVVAALQECIKKVEALEAEVAALEAN